MISVKIDKGKAINVISRFAEDLEDDVQQAIEDTVNDIEGLAEQTVSTFYNLNPSNFFKFYNSQEQIGDLSAEVTINSTFIPLVGNFPYEVDGMGSPMQTRRGDDVRVHYRKGETTPFASYNLIGAGTAYVRRQRDSYPIYGYYSPSIPVMLRDEIDYFAQLIEEAFQENVEEALGDLM